MNIGDIKWIIFVIFKWEIIVDNKYENEWEFKELVG